MTSRRSFLAGTLAMPFVCAARVVEGHPRSYDPWIEVDAEALRFNVSLLAKLAGGRPVMAVIKNNAYGLGLVEVARILELLPQVSGFAVVKLSASHALRDAGIRKPVLHMGLVEPKEAEELARRKVSLALYTDDARKLIGDARADAHLYIDTGMSRMGMPYHRALPWLKGMGTVPNLKISGTFMGFTEDDDFDQEQLRRFVELGERADQAGVDLGLMHAASSDAVFNMPVAHLDLVRPGISLYGAYPSNAGVERSIAGLRPAFRLKARVVRVERLRTGDSVSYGRNYVAQEPTWIATLPIGHTDGYSREAVDGATVLIGGSRYPVIGAVSASHTIVSLGDEKTVDIGDEAILLGPEVHPNDHAHAIGRSVYDVLMHMSPVLPRRVIA